MVQVAVIGSGEATKEERNIAYELGREIARKSYILVCGGLGGVMEAACKGAKDNGGLTVGILPGNKKEESNPWVDIKVVTAMSHARNTIVVRSADVVVSVGGKYGTLSEIALAFVVNKPVIGIKTWDIDGVIKVRNVKAAITKIKEIAKRCAQ